MPAPFPRSSKGRRLKTPRKDKTNSTYEVEIGRCITVLGSGTISARNPIYEQAKKLGFCLAKAGFKICHGGYGGVMEAVARGCRLAGGTNTGVTIRKPKLKPGFDNHRQNQALVRVNPWADEEVPIGSWQARLFKLIEMGDAYIFLDGATGMLNELFFVWEMANKKLLAKPIVVLGKRLQSLVKFLKKDPSLKIPAHFYLASSISQTIKILKRNSVQRKAFSVQKS